MPIWRCPYCGTPQAETARCWVCHRSTTSCATCRHFRRSVVTGLGLCGLDPRHSALRGTEMRACWSAATGLSEPAAVGAAARATAAGRVDGRPQRTFVPVDELGQAPESPRPVTSVDAAAVDRGGWSLWGDPDA